METATGDAVFGVKTRSKKTDVDSLEDFQLLKNTSNGHSEIHALVEDQIYQNFVETTVDPDRRPLSEDLSEDFIPGEDSMVEADEEGSSEEELDEEEGVNPPNEDEIDEVNLEANKDKDAMLKNVPPAMAEAYKKRFPHFWRTKEGLQIHTGDGYNPEEDPDFLEKRRDETIELSSESDSESSSSEEEEEMVKGEEDKEEEITGVSSMVEDMMIPDDSEELSSDSDTESSSSEEEEEMVKEEISEVSSMVEDMMVPDDTVVEHGVKTRSKKTDVDSVEDFQLLKNASNAHAEVDNLVQDQIYQNFVESTIDPDHVPLTEDMSEDFIPQEDSVIEAND